MRFGNIVAVLIQFRVILGAMKETSIGSRDY